MATDTMMMLDPGMGAMAVPSSSSAMMGLTGAGGDDMDLFGDDSVAELAGLPTVASASALPTRALRLRVDEMRSRGCCQRIAWSRQGTIASVSADGYSIELRYLRAHPHDGSWGLSEPTQCAQFGASSPSTASTVVFAGGPIVHLAWSAASNPELAVVDASGRISLLLFSMNLNRPYPLRPWDGDTTNLDDLQAVVGTYWLPLMPQNKQYNVMHGPAVRQEDCMSGNNSSSNGSCNNYTYENTLVPAMGPYHPNVTKSALLCVTASCVLRLLYSQNGSNKIQETSLEIDSVLTSDDLVTHASICSEKGSTLLVALATASGQLKVIRAAIYWMIPQHDKQQQQQQQQQQQPLNPTLQHRPAAVTSWLQHGGEKEEKEENGENGENGHVGTGDDADDDTLAIDMSADQLSHLEMLPSASVPGQSWSPAVVLTVRTYLPEAAKKGDGSSPPACSIIDRWEVLVDSPPQALHMAFEQLGGHATAPSGNPQVTTRLHKLKPIVLDKVIVSVSTMHLGKVLCFACSDGTLLFRDRLTMEVLFDEPNLARITTLNQANFAYTNPTPCTSVALSPTQCSFAQIGEDGEVTWNCQKYIGPDIGTSPKNAEYAAVMAGLTTSLATASIYQMFYDDVLATARQFLDKPRFAYDWIMEMVRMLKINVDYSEDAHHDQLMRNSSLQLCLSILTHLGFQGESRPRAFCNRFSMLALSVRNIVFLITVASNTPNNLKEKLNPLDEPEVVDALAGCTKWALDLLAYLSDSLFNLLDDTKFMGMLAGPNFGDMATYLQEKNNVALHFLLCSSTRGFLSAVCRRLAHLDAMSQKATQYYEMQSQAASAAAAAAASNGSASTSASLSSRAAALVPLSLAYQKMQRYASTSLVRVTEFDKLLVSLGDDIRQMYQAASASASASATASAGSGSASGPASGSTSSKNGKVGPGTPELAMKRMQNSYELTLLLAGNPPQPFQPVLHKFFSEKVRAFRALNDPARLYFASYRILEVVDEDDRHGRREERGSGSRRPHRCYVDVFKRVELTPPKAIPGHGGGGGGGGTGPSDRGSLILSGSASTAGLWRRCVRCASVMEDAVGQRSGYHFVLSQQRRCSCGGNWGLLPRGHLVG